RVTLRTCGLVQFFPTSVSAACCRPSAIATPALHAALPIYGDLPRGRRGARPAAGPAAGRPRLGGGGRHPGDHARRRLPRRGPRLDRKSTRLNSSHVKISYAVSCLEKKRKKDA